MPNSKFRSQDILEHSENVHENAKLFRHVGMVSRYIDRLDNALPREVRNHRYCIWMTTAEMSEAHDLACTLGMPTAALIRTLLRNLTREIKSYPCNTNKVV